MTAALGVQALFARAALVGPADVQVIRATGADRIAFLHRLLSGPVAGTAVGEGCHTLLLDTKGHVVSDIELFVAHDHLRLTVPEGQGSPTAAALERYAIMDDYAGQSLEGQQALWVLGPEASARLATAGLEVPASVASGPLRSHAEVGEGPDALWVARGRRLGVEGFWLQGAPARLAALAAALCADGVPVLPPALVESLRIAAGEPRFGAEITGNRFPMELGLDDAIDYGKGCYLGQEPIVRIRDRGHVNWQLRRLRFAAAGPRPAAGDKLESPSRPAAGQITSVSVVPALDGQEGLWGVALALVHTQVAEPKVQMHTAAGPVEAEILPLS